MEEQYLGPKTLERLMSNPDFTEDENLPLPEITKVAHTRLGEFERLMTRIEWALQNGEGRWWMSPTDTLVISIRTARDASQSCNGGDYFHEIWFIADEFGIEEREWDSSDWCPGAGRAVEEFECIISKNGLRRMAQTATITIAAKALVAKEPGSFGKLKKAVRALI